MAHAKVSLKEIESGQILAEMVLWYKTAVKKETFKDRYNRLWKEGRAIAKKRGYTAKDVERIIAEVRSESR